MLKKVLAVLILAVTFIAGCTNSEIIGGAAIGTGLLILANDSKPEPRHAPPPRRYPPGPRRY